MRAPAKTPVRYAADASFHLLSAARSAKRVEDEARDPQAREHARKVKAAAMALRKHSERLEDLAG